MDTDIPVIDVSYYQQYMTDAQWDLIAKVAKGVIIRLCFGLNKDSFAWGAIKQAKRVGLPYAGYGWVDPTRPIELVKQNFRESIDLYKPSSMFGDYEQWWSDWYAYMNNDMTACLATKFSPDYLNNYYLKFDSYMSINSIVPWGAYSADWFYAYAPAMKAWMPKKQNYWEARYFSYYDKAWYTAKKLLWGVPYSIDRVPELTNHAGVPNGIARQYSSYLEIYGLNANIGYHLDWNAFTAEGFSRMFGTVPPPQPPIPLLDVRKPTTIVNVREIPNGRIIAWKTPSQTVVVSQDIIDSTGTGWSNIVPKGWIASRFLEKV